MPESVGVARPSEVRAFMAFLGGHLRSSNTNVLGGHLRSTNINVLGGHLHSSNINGALGGRERMFGEVLCRSHRL